MTKVLFVIKAPEAGGAETYLYRFMRYVNGDYTVLCTGGTGGAIENAFTTVSRLKLDLKIGYLDIVAYFKLYKYLKNQQFDTICDFRGNLSGIVLWVAHLAGIKKRIAFYRESRNKFTNSIMRTMYVKMSTHLMLKHTTKILANSYDALNHFHPNWKEKPDLYNVIYNGFDINFLSKKTKKEVKESLSIPESSFVIAHSGRYCAAKNHDMIIKVAIEVCNTYQDVYFVLMGRNVKEHYFDLISKFGLQERIKFLGYRKDVLEILRCVDLFYFPSLTEGQPNALIEAMVNDIPFVASNIESIKEATPQYLWKYLVDPTNFEQNIKFVEKAIDDCINSRCCTCGDWAKQTFNANILFNKFADEIR